jgi:hypothetical protein
MAILLFANNIQTTLATSITSTQTSVTLASTAGLPNPTTGQYFVMTFTNGSTNEVVWVTSVSGSSITVVRGQEGTSASSFASGSYASCFPTAGTMQNLIQIDQIQDGIYNYASAGGTANALTVNISSNLTAIADGFQILVNAAFANTGASTLQVTLTPTNGASATVLPSLPITQNGSVPLAGGEIAGANYLCQFSYNSAYNGGAGAFVLQNAYDADMGVVGIVQVQDQFFTYSSSAGSSDALTLLLPSGLSTLTDGAVVTFRNTVSANATTTPTINVTYGAISTGVTLIKKYNNLPLSAGDTGGVGYVCQLVYSATNGAWMLLNPAPGVAGGVTSVTGSGAGINVSPTSGAVVITNTGVTSVNASTGVVTVTPASIGAGGLSASNIWTGSNTFNNTIMFPQNYGVNWGVNQGIEAVSSSGNLDINFSQYTSIFGGQFTGIGFSVSSTAQNEVLQLNSNEIVTGNVYPIHGTYDAGTPSGTASYRWSVVYAATATINTSDERTKSHIEPSDLGLDFVNQLNPVSYKTDISGNMVDSNEVDAKGQKIKVHTPGKRTHYGLISQEVKKVLGDKDFAGWILSDAKDPDSIQGLRYSEFISPLIKAIQELSAKVDALEHTVNIQAAYINSLQSRI